MEIANALKRAIKTRNLTISQLAVMGGVRENMAWRWLKGEAIPRGDRLIRLVTLFPELRALFEDQPVAP